MWQDINMGSRRKSCLTSLLETLELWTRLIDEGYGVNIIYIDFRKVFDTVPYERLLMKLNKYGFSWNIWNWMRSFLINRKIRVIVEGVESSWTDVKGGMPEGSVMGPLLYAISVVCQPSSRYCHHWNQNVCWHQDLENSENFKYLKVVP